MTVKRLRQLILIVVLAALAPPISAETRQLKFRVLLDDNEIGYHTYDIRELSQGVEVRSEAKFDVRFFFITAYSYRHSNVEQWQGECLAGIESVTDANGKKTAIEGSRSGDEFVLVSDAGTRHLDDCVSTFAYWNRSFLERSQLLNPQTGEYVDVEVEMLEKQMLTLRGVDIPARRYRVNAGTVTLDLWYSENDEWLALESPAKGGRTLRYERT